MGIKVKLSEIIEGIDFQSDEVHSYLNLKTGKVVMVADEDFATAEDEMDGLEDDRGEEEYCEDEAGFVSAYDDDESDPVIVAKRILEDDESFLPFPPKYELREYEIMEEFRNIVQDYRIRDLLCRAIRGKGAFRRFKDTVYEFGLQDQWFQFRDQRIKEFAVNWLRENSIDFIDDFPDHSNPVKNKVVNPTFSTVQLKTGVYRHFKGREYEVLGVARHSETLEELVVYRALYGEGQLWARPKEMFLEKVIVDGQAKPRFEYLGVQK